MFNPSTISFYRHQAFHDAFLRFMGNFTITVENGKKNYMLKSWNSAEKDYYRLEMEANKLISNPADKAFVRRMYEHRDFMAACKAAEDSRIYLSIPDHLVAID